MGLFWKSTPKCDWCGKETENLAYSKHHNNQNYRFCSKACKKAFRTTRHGKQGICVNCLKQ